MLCSKKRPSACPLVAQRRKAISRLPAALSVHKADTTLTVGLQSTLDTIDSDDQPAGVL